MTEESWWNRADALGSVPPVRRLRVTQAEWLLAGSELAMAGGRLLALWGVADGGSSAVRAAIGCSSGVLVMELPVPDTRDGSAAECYPGLDQAFPCASRMQRAVYDLCGLRSTGIDRRPWLRHAAWPADQFPLRGSGHGDDAADGPASVDDYAFVRVRGDGVHEIPVGPVHAGIIEPGHFRFSVVGEKVLRLESRLGYTHKGIERRFGEIGLRAGYRLASRISGDSAVAYAWAYCQAVESMAGCAIPPRAAWLRGIMLETERIANHLGDLGALGNDAGFAFGLAQFSRLKESWLRTVELAFGRRYLMDMIVPGGTAVDAAPHSVQALVRQAEHVAREARALRQIYDEHDGVRDRFTAAGAVLPELAARLGLGGLAGRASGQAFDVRIDWSWPPYDAVVPTIAMHIEGDVAARVAVRFEEIEESCSLLARMATALPEGPCHTEPVVLTAPTFGLGVVEGWRGPVLVAIDAGPGDRLLRCHPHDPSWQNWPALEHAVIGNIVPDFPLINKSFNLSYSGHDL